jgi:hypothetical protein
MTDLYVPGVPASVNRYYVCSERLRERGWHGVGDIWYSPAQLQKHVEFEDTFTFEQALALTGVGRIDYGDVQPGAHYRAFSKGGLYG